MVGEENTPKEFKLFFKLNPFFPVSGLSNEILFTLVAQETAKLPNVKVGGLKKFCCSAQVRIPDFFVSPTLDFW